MAYFPRPNSRPHEPLPSISSWYRDSRNSSPDGSNTFPASPPPSLDFRSEGSIFTRTYDIQAYRLSRQSGQSQCSPNPHSVALRVDSTLSVRQTDVHVTRSLRGHPGKGEISQCRTRGPGAALVIDERFDQDGDKNSQEIIRVAFQNWRADELQAELLRTDLSASLPSIETGPPLTKKNPTPTSKRQTATKISTDEIVCLLQIVRSLREQVDESSNDNEIKQAFDLSAIKLEEALSRSTIDRKPKHDKKALLKKLNEVVVWSNGKSAVSGQDYAAHRKRLDVVDGAIRSSLTHTLAERKRRVVHARFMDSFLKGCPDVILTLAMQVYPLTASNRSGKFLGFFVIQLRLDFHAYVNSVQNAERLAESVETKATICQLEDKLELLGLQQGHSQQLDDYDIPTRPCEEPGSLLKRRRLASPSSTESWEHVSQSSTSPSSA